MTKKFILVFFISSITSTNLIKTKINQKINFDDAVFNWTGTFAEVLKITGDKHYQISKPEECITRGIKEYVTGLDSHSAFLTEEECKKIFEATSGQFFGIGIVIDNTRKPKDKFLTVVNTIPNGPAEKAGVRTYDKIVEIEGKKLNSMTTEEATAKLRGPRDTTVNIKVLRENKKAPLSFEIKRDVVKAQTSFAFYIKKHDVYYVSLTTFSSNAVKQIKDILEKSAKKPHKGLILDLRNNSGGLLSAVIDIAGLFLQKGSLVVTTKDKNGKIKSKYKTTRDPVTNINIPIFILVNNYTASASEILAGCLKTHSQKISKQSKDKKLMVFIVGTKTFGKGSVQEIIPLSNNCAIKLTTSLYFIPDYETIPEKEITIQGKGITPDFEEKKLYPPPEKVTWYLKQYGREGTQERSIKPQKISEKRETPSKKKKSKEETKTYIERITEMLQDDNQFKNTIKLVNTFYIAKNNLPEKVSNRTKAVIFLKETLALEPKIDMEEIK